MHNASHTYNLQSCKTEFIVFEKRLKTGLRILRNGGTRRGTSGTLVNRKLWLVPQFPYKNHNFGEVPQFPY